MIPAADYGDRIEEDTFAASVECLLKCLDPSAPYAVLGEQISQSVSLIETALVNGGKATYQVLFDGLKSFFNRVLALSADSIRECESAFTALASRLLFRDMEITVETARVKRAQAVDSFAAVCERGTFECGPEWVSTIEGWNAAERSAQVKRILSEVAGKMVKGG
ncbi:hypothetical protein PRK78_005823 [Emydomyces testavorans]|uniref:Uncharacterized protein n=1 Tax=Emydomyces testavorans TaxID=2070801 RepID=A0AAF0DLF5_9EURO|nr:hypothetical protein PRK78_005823 [Emydomyces testavorans]